jgi:transcription elongation factor/antiterminator RfaH
MNRVPVNNVLKGAVPTQFKLISPGERWYVVHTRPHAEWRARTHLENQGFQTFLPKRLKTVRHARKITTLTGPFFPRYLFVVLDLSRDQWRSVKGTIGVSSLIMQGDLPHPVPFGLVESLTTLTDAEGMLRLDAEFQVGDRVRLTAGVFAERLGICERLDDSGRVRVLLDIMGGRVPVLVERDYLVAAE